MRRILIQYSLRGGTDINEEYIKSRFPPDSLLQRGNILDITALGKGSQTQAYSVLLKCDDGVDQLVYRRTLESADDSIKWYELNSRLYVAGLAPQVLSCEHDGEYSHSLVTPRLIPLENLRGDEFENLREKAFVKFLKKWYEAKIWNTDISLSNIGFRKSGVGLHCFGSVNETASSIASDDSSVLMSRGESDSSGTAQGLSLRGHSAPPDLKPSTMMVEILSFDNAPREMIELKDYSKYYYRDEKAFFSALVLEGHQIKSELGTVKGMRDISILLNLDMPSILCKVFQDR